MIEAIIFDFGGVIIPETDTGINKRVAEKFNVSYEAAESGIEELIGAYQIGAMTDKEFWSRFAQMAGRELPNGWENLWLEKDVLVTTEPEVQDIIGRLRDSKYKLLILSNTIPPYAKYNRTMGYYNGFDHVILSSEVGMKKPNQAFYRLALESAGAPAHDCVYIDDKEKYIEPAERLGMKTILFKSAQQLENELKELGIKI